MVNNRDLRKMRKRDIRKDFLSPSNLDGGKIKVVKKPSKFKKRLLTTLLLSMPVLFEALPQVELTPLGLTKYTLGTGIKEPQKYKVSNCMFKESYTPSGNGAVVYVMAYNSRGERAGGGVFEYEKEGGEWAYIDLDKKQELMDEIRETRKEGYSDRSWLR